MDTKITVGGQMTEHINFAMQQNYIPIFRNLILTNTTEDKIEGVKVRISFEPEFARTFETDIPLLAPNEPVEISPVRIIVLAEYLCSLTEKIVGSVHIEVFSGEEKLYSEYSEIELLAYDEWSGMLVMPEMISAFITPNHPKVIEIVSKASLYLQKWVGSPSFTGYQTKNPNIAKKQAAAIYAALQEENIAYNMPPVSYEKIGQRVRMPQAVIEQRCGTCLDLSVIFASCLEAVGLNPLLIFIDGHAFAGLWLEDETFSECIEEDISALTKRAADGIDTICLVECTDFVAGKSVDFDRAGKHADEHLLNPSEFNFAIDISRCRGSGIRPIPQRVVENGVIKAVDYEKREKTDITTAPKEINLNLHGNSSVAQEVTRKTIWERKLLDLSLRNSLLNFRPTASSLQLMTADLGQLEDEISRNEDFRIMPAPTDFTLKLTDRKIFEIENEKDLISTIAESEFRNHRLRTFMSQTELDKTLKKLHRQAKISLEENGANTLYMALGFLRWFETDKSERPRYAPLVLIPVDIIRKIQERSYSIHIRDDEVQMNITLLEMLRQDYGISISGLNPLPSDESGVDLPLVFNTIRQGVMSKKRWDIEEVAFLGQFSFSQFIMWNDIRSRSDDLEKNKVVASLVSGKLKWIPEENNMKSSELDQKVSPCDMAVPMSADSSQLAAIYEASRGQSFVLHGPPGTGKSQTITNMIANALYNGKSVLFVAEKMAALSVVQKRLCAIGLDPFCLELHSNKAQKKDVLSQLENTLSIGHIKSPDTYKSEEERLHLLRRELNEVMEELYKKRSVGLSVYDAILMTDSNDNKAISFSDDFIESADSAKYAEWTDAIRKVSVIGGELGGYAKSALKNCHFKHYSNELRESFMNTAKHISLTVTKAEKSYIGLSDNLPMDFSGCSGMMSLLKALISSDILLDKVILDEALETKREELEKLIQAGQNYSTLYNEIETEFEPSVWSYDADTALLRWKQAQQKFFLLKFFETRKIVKEFAPYAKNISYVSKENVADILHKLSESLRLKKQLAEAPSALSDFFADMWQGDKSDFDKIKKAFDSSCSVRECARKQCRKDGIAERITINYIKNASVRGRIQSGFSESEKLYSDICSFLKGAEIDFDAVTSGENWFAKVSSEANGWLFEIDNLKSRVLLENALDCLRSMKLGNAAKAYISGDVSESSLMSAFKVGVCRSVISSAFGKSKALSEFHSAQFEDTIAKYRESASKFEELTIQELAARLSAKIPNGAADTAGSSEISVLQKAIRSGGRMLPIRKLFDSIPNLLRRICPCMLMSPISVAQYINTSFPKFDLVIFDEASQMPTCEAVGAIARGENVVVVGDPKQLPPTSFFTANQVDEENIDKEDLESVLDDCLALAMPQRHLLWHYRSRHESLISFSNAKFYDNKLYTFPSPNDLVSNVRWINVKGYYDKGETKQNKGEAVAIVAEVVRRLSDETLRKESIGIVTFSVVQQILIDDMLADEYRKNPSLEQYANEMYEPILVKNLENVQGDERDVILFSIGYGPDKDGKVSMNFGPVNREGGWRRLNVAISRARKEMQVYSVITPEQINLSRTRSDGVAALRGFLEFAAKGKSALPIRREDISQDDVFEHEVAKAVRKLGYEVRCDIGSSEYKIDIGVVNPDNPETYILGIICGNKNMFEATTARDRNILQPSILKGLGWSICNVYILDWFENKQRVIEKLKSTIEKAIESGKSLSAENEISKPRVLLFEKEDVLSIADKCTPYIPYSVQTVGTPEQFYEAYSKRNIVMIISEAVEAEGPVSRKRVLKYVLNSYGIMRSGSRVDAIFDEAVKISGVTIMQSNNSTFFWRGGQNPRGYKECRLSGENVEKRTLDDICSEEICNGILLVLDEQISMQRNDIIREVAKLFGYSRLGGIIESSVSNGLDYALSNGRAVCENERILLPKSGK